jgi:hypothetical protein
MHAVSAAPLERRVIPALSGRPARGLVASAWGYALPVAELQGNYAIEQAAIEWVMGLERAAGREPRRTTSPVDIESPPRLIEVKAIGKRSCRADGFLMVELTQVQALRDNPDGYLYLVENVKQGDPGQFTLRVFEGEQLQRLLAGVKERRYYELPLRVAEYDSGARQL